MQLQNKFHGLEEAGIFRHPGDLNVEYVNPLFLAKKPSGCVRLVTAFADVDRYSKPQPSVIQDVDSTLCTIVQWWYIMAKDLKRPFSRSSYPGHRFSVIFSPSLGLTGFWLESSLHVPNTCSPHGRCYRWSFTRWQINCIPDHRGAFSGAKQALSTPETITIPTIDGLLLTVQFVSLE